MLELCLHELDMRSQVSPSRQLGWVQLEGRGGGEGGEGRGGRGGRGGEGKGEGSIIVKRISARQPNPGCILAIVYIRTCPSHLGMSNVTLRNVNLLHLGT